MAQQQVEEHWHVFPDAERETVFTYQHYNSARVNARQMQKQHGVEPWIVVCVRGNVCPYLTGSPEEIRDGTTQASNLGGDPKSLA